MKKTLFVLIGVFIFSSCEAPIGVEVDDSEPLLVIEAQINWIKETQKTEQEVILSLSSSYFSNTFVPAIGAEVDIVDSNENTYTFSEDLEDPGHYFPLDTIPYLLNQELHLNITYKDQKYTSSENLVPVSTIDSVKQKSVFFFKKERTQLNAYCMDPKNERNFTFFEFKGEPLEVSEYKVYSDDFNDGFIYDGFIFGKNVKVNDVIRFRQYGLSKRGYHYWKLLIEQNIQGSGGGAFQIPVNLNGNIKNLSPSNAYPLGYFRASEVSELYYLVK